MAVEVKPTGEHGKKKWCVIRNGTVVFVKDSNSEACTIAAELAKAEEEALLRGKKAGVAAVKKEMSKPPTRVKSPSPASGKVTGLGKKVTKKVGKKR